VPLSQQQLLENDHSLFVHRPNRVTFCNVCTKLLRPQKRCLRCEICGFRAHSQCAAATETRCKWTTCLTVPPRCYTAEGVIGHQWITGNMPGSSRCSVCNKAAGSTQRLQDYRCMWCRTVVHSFCRVAVPTMCALGRHRVSILPPTGIEPTVAVEKSVITAPSPWHVVLPANTSPLVIFINPKSGSNDGGMLMHHRRTLPGRPRHCTTCCSPRPPRLIVYYLHQAIWPHPPPHPPFSFFLRVSSSASPTCQRLREHRRTRPRDGVDMDTQRPLFVCLYVCLHPPALGRLKYPDPIASHPPSPQ